MKQQPVPPAARKLADRKPEARALEILDKLGVQVALYSVGVQEYEIPAGGDARELYALEKPWKRCYHAVKCGCPKAPLPDPAEWMEERAAAVDLDAEWIEDSATLRVASAAWRKLRGE